MTSDEIVRAVLDTYIANTNDKIVLAVIARHANSEGVCWPSRQRISEMTGLCERSVSKSVAELLGRGYIKKIAGDHTTNTYQVITSKLNVPAAAKEVTEADVREYIAKLNTQLSRRISPDEIAKFIDWLDMRKVDITKPPVTIKTLPGTLRAWTDIHRRDGGGTGVILRPGDSERACAAIDTAALDAEVDRILGFRS